MHHPIPQSLHRIARFIRQVEVIVPSARVRRDISISADYLERAAAHYTKVEEHMGRTADQINKLEQALASSRANAQHLQSQLDAAQANALDAADLAALDSVDAAIGDTTTGGAGADTGTGGNATT